MEGRGATGRRGLRSVGRRRRGRSANIVGGKVAGGAGEVWWGGRAGSGMRDWEGKRGVGKGWGEILVSRCWERYSVIEKRCFRSLNGI